MKFSSLASPKVVIFTTFVVASDENFMKVCGSDFRFNSGVAYIWYLFPNALVKHFTSVDVLWAFVWKMSIRLQSGQKDHTCISSYSYVIKPDVHILGNYATLNTKLWCPTLHAAWFISSLIVHICSCLKRPNVNNWGSGRKISRTYPYKTSCSNRKLT